MSIEFGCLICCMLYWLTWMLHLLVIGSLVHLSISGADYYYFLHRGVPSLRTQRPDQRCGAGVICRTDSWTARLPHPLWPLSVLFVCCVLDFPKDSDSLTSLYFIMHMLDQRFFFFEQWRRVIKNNLVNVTWHEQESKQDWGVKRCFFFTNLFLNVLELNLMKLIHKIKQPKLHFCFYLFTYFLNFTHREELERL